jgi:hypothetical protein
MKARDLLKNGTELHHKVRSVSDLIRHVKTRENASETPNYNLFFGAGCSVTSGIRPASRLIDEWASDLYERFNLGVAPESAEAAKAYFEEHQSSWYNKESSYSSLFERTYEHAPQRRRFVEREVDKALPAIGYAYLTSLVEKKFFNTVFTTNFDDLINEAFYQFSNDRPLVCAHHSSIQSISLTSKRPKIIKLHGDYLFDDIKSTLRETESLEQNTKDKLIEFCKEFGLIVVGYAGNDRSIMDVLDFLTKQESYLGNGVYWCLREDDEVNHALQNLFWRDKVYPVIIDGYDELFAEIHSKLIKTGLDFESNMKESKLQKIKSKILDETNQVSSNKYIQADIKNIKDTNSRQEISDFISDLNTSGESEGLSLTVLRNLLEVEGLLKKSELDQAYKLSEDFYYQATESRDKSRYISQLITISNQNGDSRSCLGWCDKLIELDPNNSSYLIRKSQFISDVSVKYSFMLDKSKNKHSHNFHLWNETSKIGLNLLKSDPLQADVDTDALIEMIGTSLGLNPSLANPAWSIKLDILEYSRKNLFPQSNELIKEVDEKIEEHIKNANDINAKSLNTLSLEVETTINNENFSKSKDVLNRLYNLYDNYNKVDQELVNEHINSLIQSFTNYDKPTKYFDLAERFYEKHLADKKINKNSVLLLGKARYFAGVKKDLVKSRSYFLSALDCSDIGRNLTDAIVLNNSFASEYTDQLLLILDETKPKLYERNYFKYKFELMVSKADFTQAKECLEKSFSLGSSMEDYYNSLSFVLLLSEDYQQLLDVRTQHADRIEAINSNVFKINYQFAAKTLVDAQYDPVELRNIIANSKSKFEHLAAHAVLGKGHEADVKRIINEQVAVSYLNYFLFLNWPIINSDTLMSIRESHAA